MTKAPIGVGELRIDEKDFHILFCRGDFDGVTVTQRPHKATNLCITFVLIAGSQPFNDSRLVLAGVTSATVLANVYGLGRTTFAAMVMM